jgi:hypothetical protein
MAVHAILARTCMSQIAKKPQCSLLFSHFSKPTAASVRGANRGRIVYALPRPGSRIGVGALRSGAGRARRCAQNGNSTSITCCP